MVENERQLAAEAKDAVAEGHTAQKAKRSSGPINETLFQGFEASFGTNEGQSQMRPKMAIRHRITWNTSYFRYESIVLMRQYTVGSKIEAMRYPSGLLCHPKVKTDCLAKSTDIAVSYTHLTLPTIYSV